MTRPQLRNWIRRELRGVGIAPTAAALDDIVEAAEQLGPDQVATLAAHHGPAILMDLVREEQPQPHQPIVDSPWQALFVLAAVFGLAAFAYIGTAVMSACDAVRKLARR